MATIYYNPRCGTSRKTLARLEEAGIAVDVIEYLKQPLSRSQLQEIVEKAGLAVHELVRSKEALYTELGLGAEGTTDAMLLDAMAEHPILMNRPIVVTEKGVRLCRPMEVVEEIL